MASQLSECGRIQSIMETTLFYEPQRRVEEKRPSTFELNIHLVNLRVHSGEGRRDFSSLYKFVIRFGDRKPEVVWVDWTCRLHRYLENRLWWVENFNNAVIPPSRELNDDFELFLRSIELFKASNIIMMNRSCDEVDWLYQHSQCRATQKLNLQQREQRTEEEWTAEGRFCVNSAWTWHFSSTFLFFSASSSGLRIRFGYVKCLTRYRRCTSHMLLRRGWYESP